MNDNVRIYLVDEYCEGASHFCFSERKDVVLLEDYEKLRAENERLKKVRNTVVVGIDTDSKTLADLMTENEKLKGELEKDVTRKILSEHCNSLQSEIKILEKRNDELCCLALHAMSELFYWLQDKYFRDGTCALSWEEKEMLDKRGGKYLNLRCKYLDAYRKAKKELKEVK